MQTPIILFAQLRHHCWLFAEVLPWMVTVVIFCLAIFVENLNVLHFWNSSLFADLPDLFQALDASCFPCFLRLLCTLSEFLRIVDAADVGSKKEREIPRMGHLALSWHACALQLSQQSGNPRRTHYQSLAVNHCNLRRELGNPGELCGHRRGDLGFLVWHRAGPQCCSASPVPFQCSSALQVGQELFCMVRSFLDYSE